MKFAFEVHPTEISYDIYSTERALEAIGHREAFGFNFDPSHLYWQFGNPVKFIDRFPDRIYHAHMKDAERTLDGERGILSSHLPFGDHRRGWDFRSVGRGGVKLPGHHQGPQPHRLRRSPVGRLGGRRHGPGARGEGVGGVPRYSIATVSV